MLFNSIQFMIFFPFVTLLYFVIPHKVRWVWLLGASYYFYMCWNPTYALLIATSTMITYVSGLLIDRESKGKDEKKAVARKKLWVALSVISNLGILFFFKYFNFAAENVMSLLNVFHIQMAPKTFDVILPVGISFYTFQALSYTIDVYRGDIYAEKNLGKYALFVSFFPQLVAGPIERSKNLLIQLNEKHTYEHERVKNGLLLMLWGFFQKIVIADRVAILVNEVYNNYEMYEGFEIAVATVLFAVQIYCDFAGYSDIAIGAAEVMGFKLMDNFKRPYFSKSIPEFWRRWHISLSSWFKDYLYIPLGGSRCSPQIKYRNLLLTFLASGLWHGASWNYVLWGLIHGIYQVLGDLLKPVKKAFIKVFNINPISFSHRLFQVIWTFILVDFAWIFFRAPNGEVAIGVIKQMFMRFNPWIFINGRLYELGLTSSEFVVMLGAVVILISVSLLKRTTNLREALARQSLVFRWAVYLVAIFVVLIFGMYGPGYEAGQFIYFQF